MIPAQLPGVSYGQAAKAGAVASILALPPRLIVIHDTSDSGSAANEAHYAATRTDTRDQWTSAHFYVDTAGVTGSLPLDRQAWAAFGYANAHGWQIEMCGRDANTPGAVPAATIATTATLVRRLCDLAGIPRVKLSPAQVAAGASGICGHYDITIGLKVGTHTDPGPAFDWAAFVVAVNGGDIMADADVPGTYHASKNADGWGNALVTMADPAPYEGGDGKMATTPNRLAETLNAIKAAVTAPQQPTGSLTDAQAAALTSAVMTAMHADIAALAAKLDAMMDKLHRAGTDLA